MIRDLAAIVVSLAVILAGCEIFTNGIEWLGRKLNLSEGAVGSVLAAVGTALPETLIPLVAFVLGTRASEVGGAFGEIGVGAIVGAPLMLSTVAYFVTGMAVLAYSLSGRRGKIIDADHRVIGRDLANFFCVYIFAVAVSFVPGRWPDYAGAAVLLVLYVLYVRRTFAGAGRQVAELDIDPLLFDKLIFSRHSEAPPLSVVAPQVACGLACIVGGAYLFVNGLGSFAARLGVSPLVLAVVVAPIATELPEKLNSIVWIRQKKDTLALGNITGAMVFQASFPPAVAMLFGFWALDRRALAAAAGAILATMFSYLELKIHKRVSPYTLVSVVAFFIAYLAYTFAVTGGR
jgi:cation:H+ antiporter